MRQNELHKAIKTLIKLNIEQRPIDGEMILTLGLNHFAQEFCTVCIGTARRTGKTEYIKRNATEDDVVIVYNDAAKHALYEQANFPVVAASHIVQWAKERDAPSIIYIDEPSLVFKRQSLSGIYDALFVNSKQTFVLLGTFIWR